MLNPGKRFPLFLFLFFLTAAWSAAELPPTVSTAPQVVAGGGLGFDFVTVITLQNTLALPCSGQILLHRGPGQDIDTDLLVNGDALVNPLSVSLAALEARRFRITAPSGLFQGAARVTDFCGGMNVTAGFDIVPQTATATRPAAATEDPPEIFSYSPAFDPALLLPGMIGRAVVDIDPNGADGLPNAPGIAVVADPDLPAPNGYQFCQQISDSQGNPQTQIFCNPLLGAHFTQNLVNAFPQLPVLNDAIWEFFVQGPPSQQVRTDVLVIDVTNPNQFRGVPVVTFNPQCDPNGLCLNNDRFQVDFEGNTGTNPIEAQRLQVSPDSGFFFFTDPTNTELLIKIIDGCAFNDHFWVFAAATTNVEYELRVTDTVSGQTKQYLNPLGQPANAVTDTQAFATCP